ncbi:hypothetical protein AVEN_123433-1, partial [Araneus ventricosus]
VKLIWWSRRGNKGSRNPIFIVQVALLFVILRAGFTIVEGGGGGDGPPSYPSIDDHNIHARSANIASSVEFGLPSEIVTAVEIVDGRLTGLYRSQALHQAKTPPKGNFSSTRLFTKAPSDHSNRVRSFAVASLCFTQNCQVSARFDFDFFRSKRSSPESQEGPLPFFKAKASLLFGA